MSPLSALSALDATRLCARRTTGPEGWSRPVPVPARERCEVATTPFSWGGLVRNPGALLVSAVVGSMLAGDAVLRVLAPHPGWPR